MNPLVLARALRAQGWRIVPCPHLRHALKFQRTKKPRRLSSGSDLARRTHCMIFTRSVLQMPVSPEYFAQMLTDQSEAKFAELLARDKNKVPA